jgi:hypothetical protein
VWVYRAKRSFSVCNKRGGSFTSRHGSHNLLCVPCCFISIHTFTSCPTVNSTAQVMDLLIYQDRDSVEWGTLVWTPAHYMLRSSFTATKHRQKRLRKELSVLGELSYTPVHNFCAVSMAPSQVYFLHSIRFVRMYRDRDMLIFYTQ